MQKVWEEELEPIMPNNVEVRYGGAPVQKVYQEISDAAANVLKISPLPIFVG